MRRSQSGKCLGQNKGPKGENSSESKEGKKKRSASFSAPGVVSSEFLPVCFVDLVHSEKPEELDVHFYSIQRKSSGIKMRDKSQTIANKGVPTEISGLSLKPTKFTETDLAIGKDSSSTSGSPLKQLNTPVLSMCIEQDLNLTKHKLHKKCSKRAQEHNSKMGRNRFLELASEIESENEKVSEEEKPDKKEKKSTILKQKRCLSDSHDDDNYASINSSPEKHKVNMSEGSRHSSGHADQVKISTPQDKGKSISSDVSMPISDISPVKSTSKNIEIFPDVALSSEMSTSKSSRLPSITGGFIPQSKRKLTSSFSPKSLDFSVEAESSLNLSSDKSLGNSFNSNSSKINLNNSFMSDRSVNSPDSLSNQTFSSSSLGNNSFLETPKISESLSSSEIQRWKQKRGMSDIGPRSYQNLAWRDRVHHSSDTLHASLLDTPPYARIRERLLDNRHLFPKRYLHAPFEKYRSFQHRAYLPKWSDWKSNFMNQCWSLENNFIDSHCHLDFLFDRLPFDGSFQKYYRKNLDTFPSNFSGCVAVFCEPTSFTFEGLWKVLLCDDMVWLAMGCHPKKATAFDEAAEKGLSECLKHPKIIAVGEIGLDYSGRFIESANIQKKVFVCQIKMALALKKPLVIHCRDAQEDCLEILKKYVPSDYRIHCHCFTKSFKLAKEWLSLFPNLYIGLTPLVTYPSAKEVHDTARNIPLERLLLETDAPYFVPKFVPRGMMKFSHPGMAISVAFEVAKLKGTNIETVLQHCLQNTKQMYGI